jgi:hypothetical protein
MMVKMRSKFDHFFFFLSCRSLPDIRASRHLSFISPGQFLPVLSDGLVLFAKCDVCCNIYECVCSMDWKMYKCLLTRTLDCVLIHTQLQRNNIQHLMVSSLIYWTLYTDDWLQYIHLFITSCVHALCLSPYKNSTSTCKNSARHLYKYIYICMYVNNKILHSG